MSTDTETYQGWTNYATWGAALILNNEQYTQEQALDQLATIRGEAPNMQQVRESIWSEEEAIRYTFADWLKNYIEELCEPDDIEAPSQMAQQMIRSGLSAVDFDEIAASIIAE